MVNEMNKQEIFNKVYLGLQSQGWKQSLNSNGGCSYRGEGGCKCAAGHLIPDKHYIPLMEGTIFIGFDGLSPVEHIEHVALPRDALSAFRNLCIEYPELGNNSLFINEMQAIHDACHKPKKMETEFKKLAKEQGLAIPESS